MRPTTPRKLLPLRLSYRNDLGSGHEAIPELFDQLQSLLDAKRMSACFSHAGILRCQPSGRKNHLSTHNGQAQRRAERVR